MQEKKLVLERKSQFYLGLRRIDSPTRLHELGGSRRGSAWLQRAGATRRIVDPIVGSIHARGTNGRHCWQLWKNPSAYYGAYGGRRFQADNIGVPWARADLPRLEPKSFEIHLKLPRIKSLMRRKDTCWRVGDLRSCYVFLVFPPWPTATMVAKNR